MIWRATGPIHGGSSVESGFEPATLRSRGRDLTTRPPRPPDSFKLQCKIPQNDDRNLKLHQSEKEPSKCPSIFHHKKMKVEESTSCQTVSASSPRGLSSSAIINIAKAAAGESAQNDEPI
ncbi:hypothetical protein AVEN_209380-1 [Araneus ventricosus]|uniref:Uncharacterized protein n=1 Tax=Araneus ventricosus TaxID=182803 RepID=A0A4Y2Q5V1_ARAVE|nr:hypothetical protein AVEN_209380-1 [Araneus ventricosus]